MMIRNLAVIGRDSVYRSKVMRELKKVDSFFAYPIDTADRALAAVASGFYKAFVLVFESMGVKQIEIVDRIKAEYPDIALILVAPSKDEKLKQSLELYNRTFFIDIDSNITTINGVVNKLILGEEVFYRKAPRYRTHTFAHISQFQIPKKEDYDRNTTVHNLSNSGARVSSRWNHLKVGDKVVLTVPTFKTNRMVRATVVWAKPYGQDTNGLWDYGLAFSS